jgi:hypothetical protein
VAQLTEAAPPPALAPVLGEVELEQADAANAMPTASAASPVIFFMIGS